jgi:hypothetical protein
MRQFNQKFDIVVHASGQVFVGTEDGHTSREKTLEPHVSILRTSSGNASSVTAWVVRRLQCEEATVSQIINGVSFHKSGPVANYLLKLAEEGGILEDMSDADREWRLARETEDAESDRESRDGYEEMERFFLCGGR